MQAILIKNGFLLKEKPKHLPNPVILARSFELYLNTRIEFWQEYTSSIPLDDFLKKAVTIRKAVDFFTNIKNQDSPFQQCKEKYRDSGSQILNLIDSKIQEFFINVAKEFLAYKKSVIDEHASEPNYRGNRYLSAHQKLPGNINIDPIRPGLNNPYPDICGHPYDQSKQHCLRTTFSSKDLQQYITNTLKQSRLVEFFSDSATCLRVASFLNQWRAMNTTYIDLPGDVYLDDSQGTIIKNLANGKEQVVREFIYSYDDILRVIQDIILKKAQHTLLLYQHPNSKLPSIVSRELNLRLNQRLGSLMSNTTATLESLTTDFGESQKSIPPVDFVIETIQSWRALQQDIPSICIDGICQKSKPKQSPSLKHNQSTSFIPGAEAVNPVETLVQNELNVNKLLVEGFKDGLRFGAYRGASKTAGQVLERVGVSKTKSQNLSQWLFLGIIFLDNFVENLYSSENDYLDERKYMYAFLKAFVNLVFFLAVALVTNALGKYANFQGEKLIHAGWQKTGKGLKTFGSLSGLAVTSSVTAITHPQGLLKFPISLVGNVIGEKGVDKLSQAVSRSSKLLVKGKFFASANIQDSTEQLSVNGDEVLEFKSKMGNL